LNIRPPGKVAGYSSEIRSKGWKRQQTAIEITEVTMKQRRSIDFLLDVRGALGGATW
jgi:hypothetical protein